MHRRRPLAILFCAALAWAAAAIGSESSPPGIFILGIDGVDPVILERMMDEAGPLPVHPVSRKTVGGYRRPSHDLACL